MTRYLILASYSDTSFGRMLQHPADRAVAVTKLIEAAGGKMVSFNWMFGPYDACVIADMPDSTAMAGTALAVISSHALKTFETYELIQHENIPRIEERAREIAKSYQPPGQEQ